MDLQLFAIIDYAAQKAIALLPQYQTYTEITLDQQNETMKSDFPIGSTFNAYKLCAGHHNWNCKELGHQTIAGGSVICGDRYAAAPTLFQAPLGYKKSAARSECLDAKSLASSLAWKGCD